MGFTSQQPQINAVNSPVAADLILTTADPIILAKELKTLCSILRDRQRYDKKIPGKSELEFYPQLPWKNTTSWALLTDIAQVVKAYQRELAPFIGKTLR